jgi:hypothetical protein
MAYATQLAVLNAALRGEIPSVPAMPDPPVIAAAKPKKRKKTPTKAAAGKKPKVVKKGKTAEKGKKPKRKREAGSDSAKAKPKKPRSTSSSETPKTKKKKIPKKAPIQPCSLVMTPQGLAVLVPMK